MPIANHTVYLPHLLAQAVFVKPSDHSAFDTGEFYLIAERGVIADGVLEFGVLGMGHFSVEVGINELDQAILFVIHDIVS